MFLIDGREKGDPSPEQDRMQRVPKAHASAPFLFPQPGRMPWILTFKLRPIWNGISGAPKVLASIRADRRRPFSRTSSRGPLSFTPGVPRMLYLIPSALLQLVASLQFCEAVGHRSIKAS